MILDEALAFESIPDALEFIDFFDTAPPDYSTIIDRPPAYVRTRTPTSYTIGGVTRATPLVTIQYLKAHLRLLRAFRDLRAAVEADPETGSQKSQTSQWPEVAKKLDGPGRWVWFLQLAVDRFQAWMKYWGQAWWPSTRPWLNASICDRKKLPPIDVLMVWHAYLLNPIWYAEDCDRLWCAKSSMIMYPDTILLKAAVSVGDISTYEPSQAQLEEWERATNTHFDPFEAAIHMSAHMLDCPRCFERFRVPFLKDDGQGYGQDCFTANCPHCGTDGISKIHLAMLKFARDLVLNPNNTADELNRGLACYPAGTLWTELNACDTNGASRVKEALRKALVPGSPASRQLADPKIILESVLERSQWSLASLASQDWLQPFSNVQRMMSAYTDDRPFSIDLVGAVIRHCSFIDKMHQFEYFDGDDNEEVLVQAIARYHGFPDLLSTGLHLFVPTLDIDLVWHTHQLLGWRYQKNCFNYVGRYIDHDDKIEENLLAKAFDKTRRVWKERFGVPYSYCGCPLPGATIGQRLANLKAQLHPHQNSCPMFVPPQQPDEPSETHESGDNAESATAHGAFSAAVHKWHEMMARRRRKANKKAARKRQIAAWSIGRDTTRDAEFLGPIPLTAPVAEVVTGAVSNAEPASCEPPSYTFSTGETSCIAGGGHGACGGDASVGGCAGGSGCD